MLMWCKVDLASVGVRPVAPARYSWVSDAALLQTKHPFRTSERHAFKTHRKRMFGRYARPVPDGHWLPSLAWELPYD